METHSFPNTPNMTKLQDIIELTWEVLYVGMKVTFDETQ